MVNINNELIDFVHKEEDLWNSQSVAYGNRVTAQKKWEEIASKLNITAALAKTKWRSFRDVYRRERLKILKAKRGDIKCKRWQYYDKLTFLKDVIVPRVGSRSYKYPNKSSGDKNKRRNSFLDSNDQKYEEISDLSDISDESSSTSAKQLPEDDDVILEEDIEEDSSPSKKTKTKNSKFAAFGNYVSEELNRLPDIMALYCKRVINDALFEAEMHTLNSTSHIVTDYPNRVEVKIENID